MARDNAPRGDLVIEGAMDRVRRLSNRRNCGRERPAGETRRARRQEAAFRGRRLIGIAALIRRQPAPPPRGRQRATTGEQRRLATCGEFLALERQGAMSLRERLAERVARTPKYRVLLLGAYLTDDLEHLAPGNRSRIEIALNF
jgi:hypothetical protein